MSKLLNIYCTYHSNDQLYEYNLHNTNIVKLFFANDFNIKTDNINYLNTYLSEIVTYYYVWKNKIISDYIGFCHYRRHFNYFDYKNINNSTIQAFNSWEDYKVNYKYYFSQNNYYADLISKYFNDFMKYKYGFNIESYNHDTIKMSSNISYIFTWDTFNNVCEFIFGFLDFISEKLNLNWKLLEDIDKINKYFGGEHIYTRFISVIIEFAVSIFIGMNYNVLNYNNYRKHTIIYNNIDKELFYKLYKLNIKSSPKYILNIVDKNYKINEEEKYCIFYNPSNYNYNAPYAQFITPEDGYDIIKKLNLKNHKLMILKEYEYIDCEDGFEFYKGNYKIKTI